MLRAQFHPQETCQEGTVERMIYILWRTGLRLKESWKYLKYIPLSAAYHRKMLQSCVWNKNSFLTIWEDMYSKFKVFVDLIPS